MSMRTRLTAYAALVGVSLASGLLVPRLTARDAAAPPAPAPAFPHRIVGTAALRAAVLDELVRAPWGAIYAETAFARAHELTFTLESRRRTLGGSGAGAYERGLARVTVEVRVADGPTFVVGDTGETPASMRRRGDVDPQDAAFEYAEEQAVAAIMPYVGGRLVGLAGDPARTTAMLAVVEAAWPDASALGYLRGLGPAGAKFAERLRARLDEQLAANERVDHLVLTLLDVDEARGAEATAAWPVPDERRTYVLNQHLGLQGVENDLYMMHGLASVDRTPWAASLAPAGARAVLELVTRHPDLLGAGVATLSKFGAADAEAARAIAALKASFPDRVGQIDGAIDEAGR